MGKAEWTFAADKPSPSHSKRLDQLERSFASTSEFGDRFWAESRKLAKECGPEIIHAIMARSHQWRGEEGLLFVPLVALLPREAALKVLKPYERSKHEAERIWAEEFQTEFEASDVQTMVEKYSK